MAHDFDRFPELTNRQMQIYYFESPHTQIFGDFEAKVVDVHDGDTVTLETDFRDFDFPLRMLDIQAPELDEIGGLESKAFLTERLLGEIVWVGIDLKNRVGKFGRLLGRIRIMGMDVGVESMQNGFARRFGI